jgi:Kelch motif
MRLAQGAAAAAVGAFVLVFVLASSRDGGGVTVQSGVAVQSGEWVQVASMSQRRSYIAAAQVGQAIYTAGGMVGESGRPLATFTRYDPGLDRWTTLPQLPVATRAAAAAAADGILYVIGGTTPDGNTAAVWSWDGESWSARSPLPTPRFNHSAIAAGGRVYVLGGFQRGRELREVLVYDVERDSWSSATPLPRRNHAFDVVDFRGELWMIGGRRGEEVLREVWILDPRTGRWREGPELPKPMELLGAAVVRDSIHAIWESTYQIFHADSGRWAQGPRPNVTRHALQTFYADGALYTVGGCTTALRDSPIVERRTIRA